GGGGGGGGVGRGLGRGIDLTVGCMLRNTPPPAVPAKANPPESIASAHTFPPGGSNPLLISLQLSPSFVERNAPPATPAKMLPRELMATAFTSTAVSPLFCSVHVSPSSVDRNMPPPLPMNEYVSAKM